MVDIVLLVGKLVFLALIYLFLIAAIRAGLGSLAGSTRRRDERPLALVVATGPRELKGVRVPLTARVSIGRAPGADLVIADDFISTSHAAVTPTPHGPVLEDLDSTNGTVLNGRTLKAPAQLSVGDIVQLGTVRLRVERL
jgi:pSer/pThr/pTyr-binding forkhead associated (FHA) protein